MEFTSSQQYDILGEPIGRGGFGCVFRVRSKTDGNVYALKTVDLEKLKMPGASKDEVKRLETMAKREAEIMNKAQPHDHIVKVFGWFPEKSIFHIVMELFERGTLKRAIQDRNGVMFPEAQITNWAAQLAITLKHLHNNNILHRDIKSENIFVTENDWLKLGDFGIARSLDSSTVHLAVGTMTHLAPELLDDENSVYNDKAEVWAYGVVLYELTQLELPFPASSNIAKMTKAVCYNPIPPITVAVSPELRSLIEVKLLDRNPASRPSMDQVICHPCVLHALNATQPSQPSQVGHPRRETVAEQNSVTLPTRASPPLREIKPLSAEDLEVWFNAAQYGNLKKVKEFVRSGANLNQINDKTWDLWTALHYCGYNGHEKIAEFLLQNGANVDEKDRFGRTPLMIACKRGYKQVSQVFVSHSANVNAKDGQGWTPLIHAVHDSKYEIVKWLVNDNQPININEKAKDDDTALQWAISTNCDRVIEFLRSKGATT